MKFSTKVIHKGQKPDETTGSIIPPIYMTSTFVQETPGVFKGYDYTRAGNPNFTNLEEVLASLEGAKYGTIFSSGMGGITAFVSATLKQGDHILANNDLYGGTYRIFKQIFEQFGIGFFTVDTQDDQSLQQAFLEKKPKVIFLETPTNPLLKISDIEKITSMAKNHGAISIVDNTFASSYFQNPLSLGADCVLHSSTKYIGGHSDVIGGVILTNDLEIRNKLDFARKSMGLNPSPFDAWLIHRGVKTLSVRMQQHQKNAVAVANFLNSHRLVSRVYYPGLPEHPNHVVAKKQMSGYGGIVSAEFKLDFQEMKEMISSFQVLSLAESLGGIESLVDHPASMTHASIPKEERERSGLKDGLVRFSIGIEDIGDILDDIAEALENYGKGAA